MDSFSPNYFVPSDRYYYPQSSYSGKKPKVVGKQRKAANERERKRMHSINKGFDRLRERLQPAAERKLSKVDTLKLATQYIQQLKSLLEQEPSPAPCRQKLIIEQNGEENPPSLYMVSWRKVPERYGGVHETPKGPTVYQRGVWYPQQEE